MDSCVEHVGDRREVRLGRWPSLTPRQIAKREGQTTFVSDTPCPRGHVGLRKTHSGGCVKCSREQWRQWYESNRDDALAARKGYRARNIDAERERFQRFYQANRATLKSKQKARRILKAAEISEQQRAYRKLHRQRLASYAKEYVRTHKAQALAHVRNRKARKLSNGGTHTAADVLNLFAMQRGRCAECKRSIKQSYHVDHIMPLVLGGSNDRRNLQLLCPPCNLTKSSAHPLDFAQRKGRLV